MALAVTAGAPARASTEHVLYAFKGGNDGANPSASLIYLGGKLYGTFAYGYAPTCANNSCGGVFSVDPKTGTEMVLNGGVNYLTNNGFPMGNLVDAGGTLFGTTVVGGTVGGTIYAVTPQTGSAAVVYNFSGGGDGIFPLAGLLYAGGTLFGTTFYGGGTGCGGPGCGTIVAFNPKTGVERVLHVFGGGAKGANPMSNLLLLNGLLYGTTHIGGPPNSNCSSGCGTVFSVNRKTGATKTLYAFKGGPDGYFPDEGLTNVGGVLYGTTLFGGINHGGGGGGTIFSIDPKTRAKATVYSFNGGRDGANPVATLIDVAGILYGTTENGGGAKNFGTVFSLNPQSGAEQVVYAFRGGQDGAVPAAGLTNVGGTLYGTTSLGGGHTCPNMDGIGCGTVFAISP